MRSIAFPVMGHIFLAGTLPEPASGCPAFNIVPRNVAGLGHGEKAGAGSVCYLLLSSAETHQDFILERLQ